MVSTGMARLAASLIFLAACVFTAFLNAQAVTAKVLGTVTDPSGASIPNAEVTIQNAETNQSRTTLTDSNGNYEFPFLPIGSYTLSVAANGFQTTNVGRFNLSVDQVARLPISLTIGQAAQAIEVAASALLLQVGPCGRGRF